MTHISREEDATRLKAFAAHVCEGHAFNREDGSDLMRRVADAYLALAARPAPAARAAIVEECARKPAALSAEWRTRAFQDRETRLVVEMLDKATAAIRSLAGETPGQQLFTDSLNRYPVPREPTPASAEWQLVPKEPTEEQCLAGHDAVFHVWSRRGIEACYRAMLAAAPASPLGQEWRDMLAALKMAESRFADLAGIISRDGKYDNAGFMAKSASRLRVVIEAAERHSSAQAPEGAK